MSRMIPQETIDVLRQFNDISVDLYGIECELRIPINQGRTERKDVYATPCDVAYQPVVKTLVYVRWNPDARMLRRLGLFTENDLPILAWFKNEPRVCLGSYIKVPIQYIPKQYSDTDEFEVIDVLIRGMHDAIAVNAYRIAPRRVKR